MKNGKILIADDEKQITTGLSAILTDEGYEVDVADDGQKALDRLSADSYGVVLADLKMPKVDGIALLKEMRARGLPTEFIMITGQGSTELAIEAIRHGAADYIEKPLNTERLSKLKAQLPKLMDQYAVLRKNRELSARLENLTHYGELTGQSEVMREVYKIIEAVSPSTASVLILGESGTGKELVARAIHQKSERVRGPFFALNCAALPKEILENELFGHEKGAFTGSTNEKPGAFELASGGTLFFDEIAEMSPDIQVKLLRALETRAIRRLGGKKELPVDIRVLAATNRDVQKAVAEGDLREDLYYRLAVVDISLPPLRERTDDMQLLANEFLERFGTQNGKQVTGFEDAAWDWILSYHWPGNVRELKNAIERAVIMSRGTKITLTDIMPRHLRIGGDTPTSVSIPVGSTVADARRQLILKTFASTGGDVARTARMLGVVAGDVRTELLALLNGAADVGAPPVAAATGVAGNGAGEADRRAARRADTPAAPARA
ncbi:MAG: sigma-54 dependent transcriptional regulator, partial [Gemmatimonadota bacterium]|nr:sigma-54 dependent transcriptional regulator [Gemmatimonadota bacterium]